MVAMPKRRPRVKIRKRRRNRRPMPRNWRDRVARETGMLYCDRDCPCGEASYLWWIPTIGDAPEFEWLPAWMNGIDGNEIWRWLVKEGHV